MIGTSIIYRYYEEGLGAAAAELAIGQCRLGVHGTCGLNNPWHHLRKMSSWVENPGRPPYVIPRGSAVLKKNAQNNASFQTYRTNDTAGNGGISLVLV